MDAVWTESQARSELSSLQASGEPIREYCRKRGLHPSRIYYWKQRLEMQDSRALSQANSTSLLPVRIVSSAATKPHSPSTTPSPMTVHLPNGLSLAILPGFDAASVLSLVDILGGA